VLIELIIVVALRSPRLALAALVPITLPVSLNFALMWALDIPLDLGTCMTGAIAIGIAVDDALHFMVAWNHEPPMVTARGTGRAMVLTSVVIAAGFASLMSADFAPAARFGFLSATAMATALLADLLVLPAFLKRLVPQTEPSTR
jgi:predicted RND superfamily exporter protein